MPDTRPGITFDENGVCSACNHYAHRKDVDWDARWKEFEMCIRDSSYTSLLSFIKIAGGTGGCCAARAHAVSFAAAASGFAARAPCAQRSRGQRQIFQHGGRQQRYDD